MSSTKKKNDNINYNTAGNGTPVSSELVHHCRFKAMLQVRLMYRRTIYENTNLRDVLD